MIKKNLTFKRAVALLALPCLSVLATSCDKDNKGGETEEEKAKKTAEAGKDGKDGKFSDEEKAALLASEEFATAVKDKQDKGAPVDPTVTELVKLFPKKDAAGAVIAGAFDEVAFKDFVTRSRILNKLLDMDAFKIDDPSSTTSPKAKIFDMHTFTAFFAKNAAFFGELSNDQLELLMNPHVVKNILQGVDLGVNIGAATVDTVVAAILNIPDITPAEAKTLATKVRAAGLSVTNNKTSGVAISTTKGITSVAATPGASTVDTTKDSFVVYNGQLYIVTVAGTKTDDSGRVNLVTKTGVADTNPITVKNNT